MSNNDELLDLFQDPSTFTPLSHLLLDNLDLDGLEQVFVICNRHHLNHHHHHHQEGNLGRAGEGLREEFLELLQVSSVLKTILLVMVRFFKIN